MMPPQPVKICLEHKNFKAPQESLIGWDGNWPQTQPDPTPNQDFLTPTCRACTVRFHSSISCPALRPPCPPTLHRGSSSASCQLEMLPNSVSFSLPNKTNEKETGHQMCKGKPASPIFNFLSKIVLSSSWFCSPSF